MPGASTVAAVVGPRSGAAPRTVVTANLGYSSRRSLGRGVIRPSLFPPPPGGGGKSMPMGIARARSPNAAVSAGLMSKQDAPVTADGGIAAHVARPRPLASPIAAADPHTQVSAVASKKVQEADGGRASVVVIFPSPPPPAFTPTMRSLPPSPQQGLGGGPGSGRKRVERPAAGTTLRRPAPNLNLHGATLHLVADTAVSLALLSTEVLLAVGKPLTDRVEAGATLVGGAVSLLCCIGLLGACLWRLWCS